MGKFTPDAVIDVMLADIATCTRMDIVSDVATPTDLTNTLANVTLTAGDGNGDYTIQDGAVSGRRLTIGAQTTVSITGTGNALHWVLSLGGTIKCVGTCTLQGLVSGGTVDIPELDHEVTDPT